MPAVDGLSAGREQWRRRTVEVGKTQHRRRRRTGRRIGTVAVDMALPKAAIIEIGLERERIGGLPAAAAGQKRELVLGGLRDRIDARPVLAEHLDRRRGGGAESVIRAGEGHVEFGLIAAGAEVGVNAAQARRRIVAPARVVDGVGGNIAGRVAILAAGLHGGADPAIRAAIHLALDALIGEAVFHLERKRAAQRIEPVDGIAGNQRHPVDRLLGDEVPIDDVAEHLVDAHPVLIDREALRRSEDRRRNEAAIIDAELELIAGLVAERDAGQSPRHSLEQVRRDGMVEIRRRECLDVGRNFVAIDRTGFADRRGRRRGIYRRNLRLSRRARCGRGGGPNGRERRDPDHLNLRKSSRALLCKCRLRAQQRDNGSSRQKETPQRPAKYRRPYIAIESYNPTHPQVAQLAGRMLPLFGGTCQGRFCQISGKIWQSMTGWSGTWVRPEGALQPCLLS